MEAAGFVFGLFGLIAFVRVEYLVRNLKAKGVLEDSYKE